MMEDDIHAFVTDLIAFNRRLFIIDEIKGYEEDIKALNEEIERVKKETNQWTSIEVMSSENVELYSNEMPECCHNEFGGSFLEAIWVTNLASAKKDNKEAKSIIETNKNKLKDLEFKLTRYISILTELKRVQDEDKQLGNYLSS